MKLATVAFVSSADNIMRMHAQSARFEAGAVYLPESMFEKGIFPHGHRRMRVAAAAMVMRVSATAVSCS